MTFRKGVSGNPSGRPKDIGEIKELARAKTPEAMAALTEIVGDKKASPAARVAAANTILDRGWGRATQVIEVTRTPFDEMSPDELRALEAALLAVARDASMDVDADQAATGDGEARLVQPLH